MSALLLLSLYLIIAHIQILWLAQLSPRWQEMMWTQAQPSLTHYTWIQTAKACLGFIAMAEGFLWLALWTMRKRCGTLWPSAHLTLNIKPKPTSLCWWMMWTIMPPPLLKTCIRYSCLHRPVFFIYVFECLLNCFSICNGYYIYLYCLFLIRWLCQNISQQAVQ